MKPLYLSCQLLTLLGICPLTEPVNPWMKWGRIFVTFFWPFTFVTLLIASYAFVVTYISTDLADAICGCFQISGFSTALYALITAHIKRDDVTNIFYSFQAFYDESMI